MGRGHLKKEPVIAGEEVADAKPDGHEGKQTEGFQLQEAWRRWRM